ncbi:hypothetical protein SCHIN_v1c03680 [Spiroplasma chinense]|uniref:PTS EIIB type-1 domain-containing protein n=1 Tax=Spiroplasma chinense TaxID=216932 RepID=A0A5B9Y441_9MOLU|nr:hypothetical protein [Spiroplasma chinense]QEH61565.1 hypothetical protein SCHIN_v1c03680 [Spiroplasma chinense]
MNFILTITLAFVACICALALLIYLSLAKKINIKFKRDKLINDPKAFTYPNILKGLGGIQNVEKLEDKQIKVLSSSLVDEKYLTKIGVKAKVEKDIVTLSVKGFNLNNFYKRLDKDLK